MKKFLLLPFISSLFCFSSVVAQSSARRHIELYQKLSTGAQIEGDACSLYDINIVKTANSTHVCSGRDNVIKQLYIFHKKDVLKEVTLLELIKGEGNVETVRFEILYEDGDIDVVIAIVKYNDEGFITSINQVFGSKREAEKWIEESKEIS